MYKKFKQDVRFLRDSITEFYFIFALIAMITGLGAAVLR